MCLVCDEQDAITPITIIRAGAGQSAGAATEGDKRRARSEEVAAWNEAARANLLGGFAEEELCYGAEGFLTPRWDLLEGEGQGVGGGGAVGPALRRRVRACP